MFIIYAEPATQVRPVSHCYQSTGPGAWIRSITYLYNTPVSPIITISPLHLPLEHLL